MTVAGTNGFSYDISKTEATTAYEIQTISVSHMHTQASKLMIPPPVLPVAETINNRQTALIEKLLLTNFPKDLSHLLHILFCYLSRHFSVIDLRWSVRERWDCREKEHWIINGVLKWQDKRHEKNPVFIRLPWTSFQPLNHIQTADNFDQYYDINIVTIL